MGLEAGAPARVALIRQRYNPYGGAERFVSRALQALAGQGVALTLITRRWEPAPGIDAVICDPFHLGSVWRDRSFAAAACRAVAAGGYDLVQSHERIACCDVYRAGDGVHREWLAQRARVQGPLARLGVALNPFHRHTLAAEAALFASPRLKAVICNSRMVKEEIRRHFGLPDERLHVIYSGVDLTAFSPACKLGRESMRGRLGLAAEDVLLAFVGSGFERKGLPALLQVLARLPAKFHLAVVGADKRAAAMEALARRLGVGGRCHFAGGQKEVLSWYWAADALALPTLYDPFPNVALEALACGLPVLTSSKCGAAELLAEGQTGFVRDALDVDGMAEALARLADPALRLAMGKAARAAAEGLSLERMAESLVALYASLLAAGR